MKQKQKIPGRNTLNSVHSHKERHDSLIENVPAFICSCLIDSTITYVNETMCSYFKLTKDELVGRKLLDWIVEDDKPEFKKILCSVNPGEKFFHFETRLTLPNGETRFTAWNNSAVQINKKGELEIQLYGCDDTMRKSAELISAENEKNYQHLFNTISEAIFILTREGIVLEANTGSVKMYGYEREELIGLKPELLSAPGKNNLTDIHNLILDTFQTGTVNRFEFWGRRKNGEIFPNTVTLHKGNYSSNEVIFSVAQDTSYQKQFDQILKESEERYKNIFNNSTAVMLIIDPKTMKIIDANDSACSYYGYTKEQITSLCINSINMLPVEYLRNEMADAKAKKKNHFFFKHKLADGSIRDVEIYSGPVEFSGKKYLFSVVHDITEKSKVQEELRLERELFVSGPVITVKWKTGPGVPIEYISPNVLDILGYPAENFISGSVSLKSLIHPDDVERCKNEAHEYQRANVDSFQQEYRMRNIIGEYNWYSDYVRLIKDKSGEVKQYRGYLFEISARKKMEEALRISERRFRYVSSSIANISYSCKAVEKGDYKIDWLYGASERITGYSSSELIRMNCWGNLVLDEDKKLFNNHILNVQPGSSDSCQLRMRHKNGNIIWVEATSESISDRDDSDTHHIYGAIVDITERKLAEEAMLRSEKELRKTNQMKDKFFSIISHDLRSPFQGLIGMANILLDDEELTNDERKEFTNKLYESLKKQFQFIDDLLTWNRIQRGAIEFLPQVNNLAATLEETIDLVRNNLENKLLHLTYDVPKDVTACFDKNMIATVSRNLISNAIKFTPHGGLIEIKLEERPDSITISVKDTGVGIEKTDLKLLWESDFNHSTKGTDGEDGTGLGLVLCKEFVERHGGVISAESKINEGSTFQFSIPKNLPGG